MRSYTLFIPLECSEMIRIEFVMTSRPVYALSEAIHIVCLYCVDEYPSW